MLAKGNEWYVKKADGVLPDCRLTRRDERAVLRCSVRAVLETGGGSGKPETKESGRALASPAGFHGSVFPEPPPARNIEQQATNNESSQRRVTSYEMTPSSPNSRREKGGAVA
jgi:hypothetical protein